MSDLTPGSAWQRVEAEWLEWEEHHDLLGALVIAVKNLIAARRDAQEAGYREVWLAPGEAVCAKGEPETLPPFEEVFGVK